jgi:hypothetical protein
MAAAAWKSATEERLSKIESTMNTVMQRLVKLEEVLQKIDQVSQRSDDLASKQTVMEIAIEDKMKAAGVDTDSKLTASELRCEEKTRKLGDKIGEAADKLLAMEVNMKEVLDSLERLPESREEGWSLVSSKRKHKTPRNSASSPSQSFADKFKEKPNDTIVLVGDSLVRGVGNKLMFQSNMVSTICRPGAGIETVTENITNLMDNQERHLVVVAGTNNVKTEGSEIILGKYEKMLHECKKRKHRQITLVGIPKRTDINSFQNSRRIGVNLRLKEKCEEMGANFIEYEPAKHSLARDGLHLNNAGQDELGRKIFNHCKSFLV